MNYITLHYKSCAINLSFQLVSTVFDSASLNKLFQVSNVFVSLSMYCTVFDEVIKKIFRTGFWWIWYFLLFTRIFSSIWLVSFCRKRLCVSFVFFFCLFAINLFFIGNRLISNLLSDGKLLSNFQGSTLGSTQSLKLHTKQG